MLIEKHKNELLTLLISMMNEKQNCGRILRLLILFCLYGICLPPLHAKQDIASPQQTGKTYTIKGVVLDFNTGTNNRFAFFVRNGTANCQ